MKQSVLTLSIKEVHKMLQKGLLSASDLCSLCLKRLEDTRMINAYITVNKQRAQKQAAQADERKQTGQSLGVLDGIPIAVKDNFSTMGIKTTCASRMLVNYIPPYNATVVEHLLNWGAVMIGKTNLDEFAMGSATIDSLFGPTRNPWKYKPKCSAGEPDQNDWYIAGGSSGGSAVAVTTGSCFGALGSDTGGSTRNPASLCGIIGLKPTYGLISRHGLIPLTNSLDVPGILTRYVDDAAFLLGILAGHDSKDSTTVRDPVIPMSLPEEPTVRGLNIGIPKEYHCPWLSSEVVDIWRMVADLLDNEGAKVTEVSLPHTQYSIVCYYIICCCEVASNFARFDGIEYGHRAQDESTLERLFADSRQESFGEVVRSRILTGNYFLLKRNYEKYFNQALKLRQLITLDFHNVFSKGIDLLLTPVTLSDAVTFEQRMQNYAEYLETEDYCTQPANLAGLPAVSFPCGLSPKQLPLSLQLIGKAFLEKEMLSAAKWIEQKLSFPKWDLEN